MYRQPLDGEQGTSSPFCSVVDALVEMVRRRAFDLEAETAVGIGASASDGSRTAMRAAA